MGGSIAVENDPSDEDVDPRRLASDDVLYELLMVAGSSGLHGTKVIDRC